MMKTAYSNLKTPFYYILLFSLLLFSTCDKNNNPIPNVYVDIPIDLTDPLYYDLQSVGGYVYITGGVNGILVYRISADEFKAYERTCPYDPDIGRISVDDSRLNAVDSVGCKSEFSLLLDGAVSKGPSQYPLKQYNCIYDRNAQYLRIKN